MRYALATLLLAQASPAPPVVSVSPPVELVLAPGAAAEARLEVTIKQGFHIQANPASEKYLVPARLELDENPRLRLGQPTYPPGRPHRLKGADKDLSTYEASFVIRLPVEASGTEPGALAIEGRLHYQACDDRVCLRPTSIPVCIPVRITADRS
jgi:hypothetical protein